VNPIVQIIQPHGWLNPALQLIQFLSALALGIATYLVTRRDKREELTSAGSDKTRERKAIWFHKIVVDDAVEMLTNFANSMKAKLENAAAKDTKLRIEASGDKAKLEIADRELGEAMTEFSVELSRLISSLAMRIQVIDIELARKITASGDEQDKAVTEWLQKNIDRKTFDGRSSLSEVIFSAQTQILRLLFDYEFTHLPVITAPYAATRSRS
jgi:hypothetical protein